MPEKAPIRPSPLDNVLGVAWIVIATFLPLEEFYAVLTMLAAFVLWGIWSIRFLSAVLHKALYLHWSWFVWPSIFFLALLLHLTDQFPYFYIL